jgi:hypothetical protein
LTYQGKHFTHPLRTRDPVVVVAMFIVVVLNVLATTSRQICNTILDLLLVMLEMAFMGRGRKLTREEEEIISKFPKDARGVRKAFDIEPKVTIFAACPSCGSIYAPQDREDGVKDYPIECTYKRYPTSKDCGARVSKDGIHKEQNIRVPLIPYAMQDFGSFLGRFYCRAGIEEMIQRTKSTFHRHKDELWDVSDGSVIKELRDVNRQLFLQPDSSDELRTVWSFSFDGFNPLLNKAAGKVVSVGMLALACLNLPPSLRNTPENLYLASLTPHSMNDDRINHPLVPIVDDLLHSYNHGRWFTRTHQRPQGRRSREAVVQVVADLPGSRKLTGAAGHSANKFCSQCWLMKKDINDINHRSWRRMTEKEHRDAAFAWRDATNKRARAKIYKETGVRWSELLRLPYFDPTRMVVVDGMHNLFLGIIRHHFRVILGMDIPIPREEDDDDGPRPERGRPPTEDEMEHARKTMLTSSATQLHRCRLPVLRALCDENALDDIEQTRKYPRKKDFVAALLVCYLQV